MIYDSSIFQTLLKESKESKEIENTLEDTKPQDITESVNIDLTDETIDKAECRLKAYGVGLKNENYQSTHSDNPQKAVQVFLKYPRNNLLVEVFLDSQTKEWNSSINGKEENRLSPDQMQKFFKSDFFSKLKNKLENTWKEDGEYKDFRDCLINKKYKIDFGNIGRKEDQDGELNEWEIRRRNVKLGIPNEKDKNGHKIRSSSGRKLIHFTDMGVSKGEESYYSWPGGTDDKHVFKWSRWNNWENQRPWIRARITYDIGPNKDVIGISLTPFAEDDKNRGFKSFDLSLQPILQYLTPEETQDILQLSLIRKFLKTCTERMEKILNIPDEEIYSKIDRPDKCTLNDIRKTKSVFKNSLRAVKDLRADTFIYTN